ncbi:helix-turn-helix transcriptional regulator [Amycolatopsis australiensis]|uniref:DNA-binding response regulator, NarL/FixJ family, contains REC and HTH domains n=1 Tax=Amycolatopsis australiensis TaxID=546364 RepID=A0A1K1S2I3_9PSEU|nr:LuxR C-terminal-related transcriptional regulator [Amycolatopsis australiensis]SFW78269.1 DNA-binding response regulator, NarL/FixJ family, contains REC and HTH domains [Amycolatopsis australiensis]
MTTPVVLSADRHNGGADGLLASAVADVVVMTSAGGGEPDPIAPLRRIDLRNLGRGVRYRVLVPDRARLDPAVAARLTTLTRAGAVVRTVPRVPASALVVDHGVAVLPARRGRPSAVTAVHLPAVVTTVLELFERVWAEATPFVSAGGCGEAGLTPRERELLTLLSAGCTDDSAAARLDLSVRTVRRMVSDLMHRLGARSRFQAGVKAAGRGWLLERAS